MGSICILRERVGVSLTVRWDLKLSVSEVASVSASAGKIGSGASTSLTFVNMCFACNAVTVLSNPSAETVRVFYRMIRIWEDMNSVLWVLTMGTVVSFTSLPSRCHRTPRREGSLSLGLKTPTSIRFLTSGLPAQ